MHSEWERSYQRLSQGEASGLQFISQLLNDLGLKLSVAVKDERSVDILVNHSH
jgi:hypothetical protein